MNWELVWASSWGGVRNEIGRAIAAFGPGAFVLAGTTNSEVPYDISEGRHKDHLYLVVATRWLNASARIIARCAEISHVDKLKRAGADSVVSPNFIGGMRMVSEMVRPAVVRFLDEMLRDKQIAMRIEEVTVTATSKLAGKSLRELDIRGRFGMNVLAVKASDADPWEYNPPGDRVLRDNMVLVVMGSTAQIRELRLASL